MQLREDIIVMHKFKKDFLRFKVICLKNSLQTNIKQLRVTKYSTMENIMRSIEGCNAIRYASYRTAAKMQILHKELNSKSHYLIFC